MDILKQQHRQYLSALEVDPFNPLTQIRFAIPETAGVSLEVFNILGQRVAVLVDREMVPGWYDVTFDAGTFSSGLYLYRLRAGDFIQSHKMTLIK